MHAPTRARTRLSQGREKALAISVIAEDRLPPITAIKDMVNGSLKFNAGFASHGSFSSQPRRSVSKENIEIHRLTLAPLKGRLGQAEGIVAGAHKLARITWGAIVSGQPYDEAKAFNLTPASAARRLKNLQNQAQALNMKLIPA